MSGGQWIKYIHDLAGWLFRHMPTVPRLSRNLWKL